MKILMVSSYLPYPLYSGGNVRLYNIIKNLSKIHEITLICEKRVNQGEEEIEEVRKICSKVITVDRGKQWSPANVLKSGFSTKSFLTTGHTHENFKQTIMDELVREPYDLIHVETFYVMQNLPPVSIPVVLVEHNIEYMVYEKYAKNAKAFIRPLLYADIFKMKREEENAWKKADRLVAVSNLERQLMKRADTVTVPNGVDTNVYLYRDVKDVPSEKRVLFIGDFKWMQNRDALETILKEIWPEVERRIGDLNINLKLWIVGRNLPSKFKDMTESPNVIFDEDNKDETKDIYAKSYILLAPLKVAGGTSYKILESMASGVAVVTTNLGISGIEAKSNVHVLAGDTYQMASMVIELLTDKSLYEKLTLNARRLIEENYDWVSIAKKLNEVYLSCTE